METIRVKQRFLDENTDYKEVKPSQELATIGEFQDIDEFEDEVWLLQCPKGLDIEKEIEGQKFKIPGRTNFNAAESVAAEYAEPQTRAFGYCNRKGRYSLRLLPIKGNILLRGRLKGAKAVTLENAEALCPPQERMPLPDMIKVRHPLHGHQFDKSIRVDKATADRLRKADEISAKALREAINNQKNQKNVRTKLPTPKKKVKPSALSEDDDVTFVDEVKINKLKKKQKHSGIVADQEVGVHSVVEVISKKKIKSHKSNSEEVAKDLQWIQNL